MDGILVELKKEKGFKTHTKGAKQGFWTDAGMVGKKETPARWLWLLIARLADKGGANGSAPLSEMELEESVEDSDVIVIEPKVP